MKKMKLGLEELRVESFAVLPEQLGVATIQGYAALAPTDTCPASCLSCQTNPCGTCGVGCSAGGSCGDSCQTQACGSCPPPPPPPPDDYSMWDPWACGQ